jgi:CubicO group peptidase (beta-lactamase class C family)
MSSVRSAASAIILLPLCVQGQQTVLSSRAKNQQSERQADAIAMRQMQKSRTPGMQVAVLRNGQLVLVKSYGVASVELGTHVQDDTLFSINSITKAFTGVAAAQLIERGLLDAHAPMSKYLDHLPATWNGITVEQVMAHMSGLPDVLRAPNLDHDPGAAWLWTLAQPPHFPPGERYEYSQTNYVLAQRMVNRLSARKDDAPVASAQFAMLGLAHSRYGDSDDVVMGKASEYHWRYQASDVAGTLRPVYERFPAMLYGSAGINSTATDMATWANGLLSGKLMSNSTRDKMWTPVAFANGSRGQWGLGWEVFDRGGHRMVGMTGGGRSAVFLYPDDDLAVIVLTNLAGAYPKTSSTASRSFMHRIFLLWASQR